MLTCAPVERSRATLQSRSQLEPGKTTTAAFMSGAFIQDRDWPFQAVRRRKRRAEGEGLARRAAALQDLQASARFRGRRSMAGSDPPQGHVKVHRLEPLPAA